ncbi:MAG: hypothetical protein K2K64_03560 [Muribaculaceae bacterium]|nr:hypothetical protein [Muribaculaceae bacterium]MDE7108983.1 hypothetical protein [Muribaculaceae bacterium]
MTQLIATLDSSADTTLLKKIIENIKGVSKVKIFKMDSSNKITDTSHDEWINEMMNLSNSTDSSIIDLNDPRTKYILGK